MIILCKLNFIVFFFKKLGWSKELGLVVSVSIGPFMKTYIAD